MGTQFSLKRKNFDSASKNQLNKLFYRDLFSQSLIHDDDDDDDDEITLIWR